MARRSGAVRERRAGWGTVLGITSLIAADLLLVGFAISSANSIAASHAELPALAPSTEALPPTAELDLSVEPLVGVLGAVDSTVAYRALTSGCPGAPTALERTADGGVTWTPTTPAGSSISQILTDDADVVSVIAVLQPDCVPTAMRSYSQGTEWQSTDELTARWHLSGVHAVAPGGVASTPCPLPLQIAPRDDRSAAVLCADASVAATVDAGASWFTSARIDGASAIARSEDAYRVAVTGVDGCLGVQVVSLSPALVAGSPGACVASDAADGATSLATANDGSVWIWSGDVVAHSSDGGTTW